MRGKRNRSLNRLVCTGIVGLAVLAGTFVEYMPKVVQRRIDECEEPYKGLLRNFKDKIDEYLPKK